jgi:hypothetical protein
MPSTPIRLLLAAGVCVASTGAMAQALRWQVSEASGPVTIRHGASERAATRGAALDPGDTVTTGATGRAVLVHERDFVTLAPRSRAAVPAAEQASGFTKLLQNLGNAVYKIEKRGVPHFGVTTPYLAAVVKGTTFSVTVDTSGASLQVVEGAVEVATPDGGARDLIRPGSIATIAAGDLFRLKVHGDEDRVVDSPARPHGDGETPAAGGAASTSTIPSAVAAPAHEGSASASVTIIPAADASDMVIATAITSKPIDFGQLSGGLVTGTANVAVVTASVAQSTRAAPVAAPTIIAPPPVIASAASVPVVASPVAVAAPVPAVAAASAPAATPVVGTPAVTVPVVTTPVATTPAVTVPAVTAPVVTTPAVAVPVATTPVVATPVVTVPAVTTPVVTTPAVTVPVATTPVVTTPAVAVPAVTTPVVTTPAVTVPVATTPVVTTPVVTVPAVTAPVVTTPVVTVPIVATSAVTVPFVTAPVVTTPVVTSVDPLTDPRNGNNGKHLGELKNGTRG